VCSDDGFNGAELDHHLLVVCVALCGGSGLDGFSHHHVDFQALSLLVGEFEEVAVLEEEVDVLPLLNFVPIVMIFGGVGLGVYSGLDRLYLGIISQIL
jgi:hypothetical protein